MAKKIFSDDQVDLLVSVARRHLRRFKNQEEMALALKITQPSLSNLLKGKWRPGLPTARHIAQLDGMTLEELLPDFDSRGDMVPQSGTGASSASFTNLETCIAFHAGTRQWKPWTLAAARAGFFGNKDFPAPEWTERLDALERGLEKIRK